MGLLNFSWTTLLLLVIFRSDISVSQTGLIECDIDVMIIVDSSGSVYDSEYANWNSELDFAKNVVNQLNNGSRVGLINFSGCLTSYTVEECREEYGRFVKVFGLNTYRYDLPSSHQRIDAMDGNDFLGGWTWTDIALYIALTEFQANSTSDRNKAIILVTDGEPNQGYEPCNATHVSTTLQTLRDLNVNLVVAGIAVRAAAYDDSLRCITTDFDNNYFDITEFADLADSVNSVCERLSCNASSIPTTNPTIEPTTLSPTAPTMEPTYVPISDPTMEPIYASDPTMEPIDDPTKEPIMEPTNMPTIPSKEPTMTPSLPTSQPHYFPSDNPVTPSYPSWPTMEPTHAPHSTEMPVNDQTKEPTMEPTMEPTAYPVTQSYPSPWPTRIPTPPTSQPSYQPTFATLSSSSSGSHSSSEENITTTIYVRSKGNRWALTVPVLSIILITVFFC